MSWVSDEHKKLYSSALSALYSDVKGITNSIINTTANYVSNIIPNDSNSNSNSINISDVDMSGIEIDENLIEIGKSFPNVLIKLHKNEAHIVKIYIIDDSELKPIKGKIDSYPYISKIIHEWFIYENNKWYPTEDLYTEYRNLSSKLCPMDKIIFKYQNQEYKPNHYKNDNQLLNK